MISNNYIQAAWLAAYTALWNGICFSTTEQEQAKEAIRQWLSQQAGTEAAYKQMVQRILLARQYLTSNTVKYAPIPTEWFATSNNNGYAGTQRWYHQLQQQRQAMPLKAIELKAFAEAVLEMQEEPTGKNFHYWRSYFAERNKQQLLNLFLSTVAWQTFDK